MSTRGESGPSADDSYQELVARAAAALVRRRDYDVLSGLTAADVHAEIHRHVDNGAELVALRTVQRYLSDHRRKAATRALIVRKLVEEGPDAGRRFERQTSINFLDEDLRPDDIEERVKRMAMDVLEDKAVSDASRMRLALSAYARLDGDDETRKVMSEEQARQDSHSIQTLEALLATFSPDVKARRSFMTEQEFAMAADAVMEGFALRVRAGWPVGVDRSLPGKVLVAVLAASLCITETDPPPPGDILRRLAGQDET